MRFFLSGGTDKFRCFIQELIEDNDNFDYFQSSEDLPLYHGDENVYILLPDYPRGKKNIPEMSFTRIMRFCEMKECGTRLYIENYCAKDYLHPSISGFQIMGRERYLFQEYIEYAGMILQARNSFYYPSYPTVHQFPCTASVSNCIGTHRVFKEGTYRFPLICSIENSNFIGSAMNFSDYDPFFMRPYACWKKFFIDLFSRLTGKSETLIGNAFEKIYPQPIKLSENTNLKTAINAVLRWHNNSGLLRAPDGTKGMYEMIRSDDLNVRSNLRVDSCLLTGALFTIAGIHYQNSSLVNVGKNLVDFMLDRHVQLENGLFKWFDNLNIVWSSDSSRDGLALINMYKATGLKKYLFSARKLGNGLLDWLGEKDLCCGSFDVPNGYANAEVNDNPVFYGEMVSFLLQLQEEQYAIKALKIIDKISEKFPKVTPFGFSDNFTYSRYLLMLSCAQYQTECDYSSKINRILDFFENLQNVSGGISECAIRIDNHPVEAGVAVGNGFDAIADILYCNNFVFSSLSILRKLDAHHIGTIDTIRVEKMYQNLKRFLLRIQIKSEYSKFNGCWMRAFDMEYDEYYGLNKDMDWGPYCIMAGWVTGFIPLVLLHDDGAQSFFI